MIEWYFYPIMLGLSALCFMCAYAAFDLAKWQFEDYRKKKDKDDLVVGIIVSVLFLFLVFLTAIPIMVLFS